MQTQFFDQPQDNNSPPLLPGPSAAKRLFRYDGQLFEDPGPEYSVQDVLAFLAETYPELRHGTWTSRSLPDGTEEITFVKVTGEKGSGPVSPRDLLAALDRMAPAEVGAITLLRQLEQGDEAATPPAAADLLALSPRIDAALQQAEQISNDSQRIVRQCLALSPIPHPQVPLGF